MPANFPDNPTVGQEFTVDGRTWTWTGAVWNAVLSIAPNAFTASDTAPSSPVNGTGWFDSTSGQFFIYYDQGWVEFGTNLTGPQGPSGPAGADGTDGQDGVASAVAPLSYNPTTKEISINLSAYDTSTQVDTKISTAIANLVDSAPSTLDTLNELAAALSDDASFAATVANQIGTIEADVSNLESGLASRPLSHNYVINGGFDIWQRGTSIGLGSNTNVYFADMWSTGNYNGVMYSKQTSGAPAGSAAYLRVTANAPGLTGNIAQAIETNNALTLIGKQVTLSAKFRKSSGFTSNIQLVFAGQTTQDATPLGGSYFGIDVLTINNSSLPTGTSSSDWYQASTTFTIPSNTDYRTFFVRFNANGETLQGEYYDAADIQLEIGSAATPFRRHGSSIQGELTACQRYYWRFSSSGASGGYMPFAMAHGIDANAARGIVHYPTRMRVAPSLSFSAASTFLKSFGNPMTSIVGAELGVDAGSFQVGRSNEFAANQGVLITANNTTSAFIEFSAEL